MDYKYKQLEQQVSALGKVFADLGAQLSDVSKQLATSGAVPPARLIDQIQAARTNFETVCVAVHGHAASLLVAPLPKAADIGSISAIVELLKLSATSEENKFSLEGERERAMATLSNVLAIRHREQDDFKPLQECHAKIAELRDAVAKVLWPQRHPQSESITSLKHPATALLSFVENLDTLEDDRWIAFENIITEHYGKALFIAASRGKLTAAPAKPIEKNPVVEKPADKPTPAATVEKKAVAQPFAAAAPEKKETVPAPPKPVQALAPSPAPAPTPAPVLAAQPAPAATVAPPPTVAASVAPAAPAVSPAPTVVTTAPVRPTPPPAPPSTAPLTTSLTALATATETPNERKLPSESVEKQRKEPRLASPTPQMATKPEIKHSEPQNEEPALAGDGSQRPQRWGFWRGNR